MFWRPLFTESNLPNVLDDEFQNVVNDLGIKEDFLEDLFSVQKNGLCVYVKAYKSVYL